MTCWAEQHPKITKLIIAMMVLVIVVISMLVEVIGDIMSVLLFIGLCGIGLWAISSMVYTVFFE